MRDALLYWLPMLVVAVVAFVAGRRSKRAVYATLAAPEPVPVSLASGGVEPAVALVAAPERVLIYSGNSVQEAKRVHVGGPHAPLPIERNPAHVFQVFESGSRRLLVTRGRERGWC